MNEDLNLVIGKSINVKAADYYDYCYGFANSNPDSNGTDSDFYRPRLLGHYWCMVNGTPVELPVYHVRDARDYIRWWLDDKQGRVPGTREVVKVDTYQQLFRPGTHAYEQAVKFDNNWVYLPIPCSKGGYKRIDYERTIQEMARETSYTDCNRYLLVCSKCGKLKRKRV